MEKEVDWKNPPRILRVAKQIHLHGTVDAFEDSNTPPTVPIEIPEKNLLESLAEGSNEVNIMLGEEGPFLRYKLISDETSYVQVDRIQVDRKNSGVRNITYELSEPFHKTRHA